MSPPLIIALLQRVHTNAPFARSLPCTPVKFGMPLVHTLLCLFDRSQSFHKTLTLVMNCSKVTRHIHCADGSNQQWALDSHFQHRQTLLRPHFTMSHIVFLVFFMCSPLANTIISMVDASSHPNCHATVLFNSHPPPHNFCFRAKTVRSLCSHGAQMHTNLTSHQHSNFMLITHSRTRHNHMTTQDCHVFHHNTPNDHPTFFLHRLARSFLRCCTAGHVHPV